MTWAATAITVGTSVAGAVATNAATNKQSAGSKVAVPGYKPLDFNAEDFFVDSVAEARKANKFTESEAVPAANRTAGAINEQTMSDLQGAMSELFGGEGDFESQRDLVNENTASHLRGEVSEGTRRQIGRSLLQGNMTELGGGGVNSTYGQYLGLQTEQLTQVGGQEYRSLYSMYRQSMPLTTGAQLLPQFALTPGMAITSAHQNSQLALQGAMFESGENQNIYNAALTAEGFSALPDPVAAARAEQSANFWGDATTTVGKAASTYFGAGQVGGTPGVGGGAGTPYI